jgi:DNA (cytosine-5)-methyltransferase 1
MIPLRWLDTYCASGGVARGITDAGHRVTLGVDINPWCGKPDKPGRERKHWPREPDYLASGAEKFWCGDALEFLADLAARIHRGESLPVDVIWASPPCQTYSGMSTCRPGLAATYPGLIGATRDLLAETRLPFIIENVEKARPWLRDPVMLCGFMLGRPTYRHRLFEFGGGLVTPEPPEPPADIRPLAEAAYKLLGCPEPPRWQSERGRCGWPHPIAAPKAAHWEAGCFAGPSGNEYKDPSERSLGISWMHEREDRAEAIPPNMARWVAEQVAAQLERVAVS